MYVLHPKRLGGGEGEGGRPNCLCLPFVWGKGEEEESGLIASYYFADIPPGGKKEERKEKMGDIAAPKINKSRQKRSE